MPRADPIASGHLREENGDESGGKLDVSGRPPAGVSPSFDVHVQSHRTVTLDRNLRSWRVGVSVGRCGIPASRSFLRSRSISRQNAN